MIALAGGEAAWGLRSLPRLQDFKPGGAVPLPRVSVIIPARNEAAKLEEALASVLALDYSGYEVIAINDRSTDDTGALLDRIAVKHPGRLRVLHLTELPKGWLGKNYALHYGATIASGDLLLFTDADVVFHPSALSRAVCALDLLAADHLTAGATLRCPTPLLRFMVALFILLFLVYTRPWRARDKKSKRHAGIGAFNLIRASTYKAIGGHGPIRLRPDDDLMLGKLVKLRGFRQELADGSDFIEVEWYSSVGELIHGLSKNSFAGLGYSVPNLVLSTAGLLLFFVFPYVALPVTTGPTQLLYLTCVVLPVLFLFDPVFRMQLRLWQGLLFPFGVVLFLYILWRSTLLTLVRGGIEWRGTQYSLAELRANKLE
ncbi:MAG: glycosyltransferase family 2 protein [bacterium]